MRLFLASLSAVLATATVMSVARAEPASLPEPTTAVVPYTPGDDAVAAAGGDASISNILFVDRCVGDCIVRKGPINNSTQNTSAIPEGDDGDEFVITEWAHGDAAWNTMMQCLRDIFLPYDVIVTDVDPGTTPHHQAIAAGLPANIGREPNNLGVAPGGCEPRNNMLSFTFANAYPASRALEICATVGQESSHSFGIQDHLFDCTDPMTYLEGCGQKFFRNKQMKCGEFEERACVCAGTRQNSHVKLLSVFGPGSAPIPAPTVSISSPTPGATITNNSVYAIAASDQRSVYRLQLFLNDWLWAEFVQSDSITPPFSPPTSFTLTAAAGLPDGNYDVKVVAFNDLGINTTSSTVSVVKGAACTSADSCLAGQSCTDGKCAWAQPTGVVGDACTYNEYCIGENTYDGQCQDFGDGAPICTLPCFTGLSDACPDSYACLDTSGGAGSGLCYIAPPEEDTGCCSASTPSTGRLVLQFVMIGLVGGLVLRRRRSR